MTIDLSERFCPVAPPQFIENAYTDDQHRRILQAVRDKGPWPLILAKEALIKPVSPESNHCSG